MTDKMSNKTPIDAAELYMGLLKKCLTRYLFSEYRLIGLSKADPRLWLFDFLLKPLLQHYHLHLVKSIKPEDLIEGLIRPAFAETMIGLEYLNNLQLCTVDVLRRNASGNLIECNVWRGGAVIFMKAVLKVYSDTERIVWVASSFQGLPNPDPKHNPADRGDRHWIYLHPAVSMEQVRENLTKYGLPDDRVLFLRGCFCDTLPNALISRFAILRIDADRYQSTMGALRFLYLKLSIGGDFNVDDYVAIPSCKADVEDFRMKDRIDKDLNWID